MSGTLTVSPVALAVIANNASKVYGTPDPTFTASYSGFVNGDGTAALSGSPTLVANEPSPAPVGNYTISVGIGSLSALNYTFSPLVNGTFSVTPATPVVSSWPTAGEISYGQTLASSALTPGSAPGGKFRWTNGSVVPPLGETSESVTFWPDDAADYTTLTGSALVPVIDNVKTSEPVLSSLDAPYPDLQNASLITVAGQQWGAGTIAYGPPGTPLVLSGANLGDSGALWFVSYKNGAAVEPATVRAAVTLWTPTAIFFSVPGNATTGVVEVVTGGQISNPLPFIVTQGTYSASCPAPSAPKALAITTDTLPDGAQNQSYSVQLTAVGGSGSYSWALSGGSLPAGLSLSSSGAITGTPTTPATPVTFTVQVADSSSPQQFDAVDLSLQIAGYPEGTSSASLYSFSIQNAAGNNSGYDAVGNVIGYTDSVNGTWSFGYDTLNRLETASGTQGDNPYPNYCWQYDNFGNRQMQVSASTAFGTGNGGANSCTTSGAVGPNAWAAYNVSNSNRMDATSFNTTQAVNYDADGNVTYDGVNSYLYDGEGRICAVQMSIAGIKVMTQYLYDAEGNRVAKGAIASFSCDNSINAGTGAPNNGFTPQAVYVLGRHSEQLSALVWNAQTSGWQAAHTNVYASGQQVATYDADLSGQKSGKLYFHLSDWLGTRRQQTDYAGNPVLNFTGLPYGDGVSTISVSTGDDEDATEHHFTGKERDSESGNDYFGARYYASTMGRFVSPDPSQLYFANPGNPQSFNLYAYALNNPLKFVDPTGMYCYYGNTDFSSAQGQADQTDATQWDYHSSSGECGQNGGQWYDDAYTHNGVDDLGRPEYAVSSRTDANNGDPYSETVSALAAFGTSGPKSLDYGPDDPFTIDFQMSSGMAAILKKINCGSISGRGGVGTGAAFLNTVGDANAGFPSIAEAQLGAFGFSYVQNGGNVEVTVNNNISTNSAAYHLLASNQEDASGNLRADSIALAGDTMAGSGLDSFGRLAGPVPFGKVNQTLHIISKNPCR